MAYNNVISANDPQAVEKLTEKLQKCEELQTVMKGVNAYWRKTGTCMGAPGITEEQAKKLDNKVNTATVSWERQPFSSYSLTNNNSEIKRLKSRIAEVTRHQEVGFSSWEFNGGRAEANTELNRLQLIFDERPDSAKHSALRHAGFVYSHTNGAYQRQLNDNRAPREKGRHVLIFCECFNRKKSVPFSPRFLRRKCRAIYAAGRLDFVKPSDGRTVREHQPKAPVKDTGAR